MPSERNILTLQASLEALALLADVRLMAEAGEQWTATELLHWFQTHHPEFLQTPVFLVPPDATRKGALSLVDADGEVLPTAPLCRLERRQPTGAPC